MKTVEIKDTELSDNIGADILFIQKGTGIERKVRLTKIKNDKVLGVGHNGKEVLYYEFAVGKPVYPESNLYKIIH